MNRYTARLQDAGMTGEDVAQRAAIATQYLYRIFAGRQRPSVGVADAIQAACDNIILSSEIIRIKPVLHRVDKAKTGRK